MFAQTWFVAFCCLASFRTRAASYAAIVVGIGVVTGVILTLYGLKRSLTETLEATASSNRAVVLQEGAHFIGQSWLGKAHEEAIVQAPGIRRQLDGSPLVGRDVRATVTLEGRADGVPRGVVVRGISPTGLAMRPEIRVVKGRMFAPGKNELVVGRSASGEFANATLGSIVQLGGVRLRIVGVFESGDWIESGFVADDTVVEEALGLSGTHSISVELENRQAYWEFRSALEDHVLGFQVLLESDYYSRLTLAFGDLLAKVTLTVMVVLSFAGVFAVLDAMNALVTAHSRAIGVFRAAGFSSINVSIAVVLESTAVAMVGAVVGTISAWLWFDDKVITTGSEQASVVHTLQVSLEECGVASVAALLLSLLGAVAPAVKAARLPLSTALAKSTY